MSAIRGDILCFDRVQPPVEQVGLCRTVSTYGRQTIEFFPVKDEPYVIRSNFDNLLEMESLNEPDREIGWELIYNKGKYYARVAQYGYDPVELRVTGVGRANEIPVSRTAGTVMKSYMADIEEYKYEEEPEVNSKVCELFV